MTDNGASMKKAGTTMAVDKERLIDCLPIIVSIPTETRNEKSSVS